MKPTASIVISSHNRLGLFRRTLWAIAHRGPKVPFEVVVVDDGSTEDVLGELKLYSARFPWKFVRFDAAAFEAATGLTKFLNNPCVTNNIGFKHAAGDVIFQQGNEVIPWADCYDRLLRDVPREVRVLDGSPPAAATLPLDHYLVVSTTYDVPRQHLERMDRYGANLTQHAVDQLVRWPLQSREYRSDVTNYVSLAPRATWEALGGYDERYYGGISAEDSDFVRRARLLPGFQMAVSDGVSLHQYHGGRTTYYTQDQRLIDNAKWEEGVAINHAIYHAWDGTHRNPQKWSYGTIGVGEIVTNCK